MIDFPALRYIFLFDYLFLSFVNSSFLSSSPVIKSYSDKNVSLNFPIDHKSHHKNSNEEYFCLPSVLYFKFEVLEILHEDIPKISI